MNFSSSEMKPAPLPVSPPLPSPSSLLIRLVYCLPAARRLTCLCFLPSLSFSHASAAWRRRSGSTSTLIRLKPPENVFLNAASAALLVILMWEDNAAAGISRLTVTESQSRQRRWNWLETFFMAQQLRTRHEVIGRGHRSRKLRPHGRSEVVGRTDRIQRRDDGHPRKSSSTSSFPPSFPSRCFHGRAR